MSLRTTRQASEVLGTLTGPISVTRQMVEALVEGPGSLRTTRQATEVLGTTTGPVNVTRQMVEALVVENSGLLVTRQIYEELLQVGGLARVSRQMCEVLTDTAGGSAIWNAAASSSIVLGCGVTLQRSASAVSTFVLADSSARSETRYATAAVAVSLQSTATASAIHVATAASCVELDQDCTLGGIRHLTAITNLGLGQSENLNIVRNLSANTALALAGTPSYIGPHLASASSVVNLASTAYRCQTLLASAQTSVLLKSSVATGLHLSAAASNLSFVDAADQLPRHLRTTTSQLTLTDLAWGEASRGAASTVAFSGTAYSANRSAAAVSTVSFTQAAMMGNRVINATATSALQTTTQEVDPSGPSTFDVITGLQDQASAEKVEPAYYPQVHAVEADSDFTLSDSPGRLLLAERSAESTITLAQCLTYGYETIGIRFQYHPLIGEGASASPSPTLAGPMSGVTVPFQLVYPATGTATDTVTVRAPALGNKDRLSFNRVLRETRGGTLIVFADPMWPKIQTLVLNFVGLTRSEAQDLLTFIETYLGQEVGMIDWERRYWTGIITVPDQPVTEDSRGRFSASFEFEGELT